jgi:hypothetical protein
MEAPDPDTISIADMVICIIIPSLIVIAFFLYLVMTSNAEWEPEDEDLP